jgi:hypothetical protein
LFEQRSDMRFVVYDQKFFCHVSSCDIIYLFDVQKALPIGIKETTRFQGLFRTVMFA